MGCMIAKVRRMYGQLYTLTPQQCIQRLCETENILRKLMARYSREALEARQKAHACARNHDKIQAMSYLKKARMLDHQAASLALRVSAVEAKRLSIEQLGALGMQVESMSETSKTFKSFLKTHQIDRIEKLKDELSDMITETCDIGDTLSEELPLMQFDDDDLEKELNTLLLVDDIKNTYPAHFIELPEAPALPVDAQVGAVRAVRPLHVRTPAILRREPEREAATALVLLV